MATSDIALERVQALLKVDTGDGSLHTHLVRIARALAAEKPDQALSQLEQLSWSLKKAGYRGAAGPDPEQDIVADAAAEDKRKQWCIDSLKLVRPPTDLFSTPKVMASVQSFMEDAAMFEWAGVGFGKQESYHIAMSLRKLAGENPSLDHWRFWGKIMGTDADYYVTEFRFPSAAEEGADPAPPKKEPPPGSPEYDVEPRGEGANMSGYFVSAGGAAPWVRLPAARASHIVESRKIKHLMTGDLGSPVLSMPFFPGKERHFLRAQIARITATCNLAPAGYYEDDGSARKVKVVGDPGYTPPDQETLAASDGSGWVHATPALLAKTGKCFWPEGEEAMADWSEEAKKQLEADSGQEEAKALLAPISDDLQDQKPEDMERHSPAWYIKAHGDKGKYGDKSYRITSVRSLIWPGAITVAQNERFANIYIGYGLKSSLVLDKGTGMAIIGSRPFSSCNAPNSLAPQDVQVEPEDIQEQDEPQPQNQDEDSDGQKEFDDEDGQ